MKTLLLFLLFVALTTSQRVALAAPAPPTSLDSFSVDSIECPSEPGVYVSRNGGWKRMEEIRSAETVRSSRRLPRLAYGLRPNRIKAIFSERSAPVKVKSAAAIFCVVGLADRARDLRMGKLATGSGLRELEIKTDSNDEGGSAEEYNDINEKDRIFFDSRRLDDRTFILQAPVDLHPGEYVLFRRDELDRPDMPLAAFDFSVDAEGLLRRMRF